MNPAVHILVFEGFADWEPPTPSPSSAVGRAGRRRPRLHRRARALDGRLARGARSGHGRAGIAAVRLLLLPGGDMWEGLIRARDSMRSSPTLHARGVPIAAICGATLALARAGLLNDRAHTSNEQAYLTSMAPEYTGAAQYVDQLRCETGG